MANTRFEELIEELNINAGDVLFIHSSWDRLRFLDLNPLEIINKLKAKVGKNGLLFMPTYPWLYPMKLFNPNEPFLVSSTPSALGFLSEVFRRSPGVCRSANPFFPVSGFGDIAHDLLSSQENVKDLFSNESVFGKLIPLKVKQLGLGVSVGLSSFIHIVDWRLRDLLDFKICQEVTVSRIELENCTLNNVHFLVIPENIFKVMNSKILFNKRKDLMDKIIFRNVEGNFFYSYYIQDMLKVAHEEAKNALRIKTLSCWYIEHPSKSLSKV